MLVFQLPLLPIQLSFCRPSSLTTTFFSDAFGSLTSKVSTQSFHPQSRECLIIRMGGGPRTYPGGVSKWQWKRMQAKKAKQVLKARLCRERHVYEMRKRAELMNAAISELERPWEVVEMAPMVFNFMADDHSKVLADRFQRPGGFDLWSEKDGPQLFETVDGFPVARSFPKGVVHIDKPYVKFSEGEEDEGLIGVYNINGCGRRRQLKGSRNEASFFGEDNVGLHSSMKLDVNKVERKSTGRTTLNNGTMQNRSNINEAGGGASLIYNNEQNEFLRLNGSGTGKSVESKSDIHDLRLQQDGIFQC